MNSAFSKGPIGEMPYLKASESWDAISFSRTPPQVQTAFDFSGMPRLQKSDVALNEHSTAYMIIYFAVCRLTMWPTCTYSTKLMIAMISAGWCLAGNDTGKDVMCTRV